jgi:hypothetical protein
LTDGDDGEYTGLGKRKKKKKSSRTAKKKPDTAKTKSPAKSKAGRKGRESSPLADISEADLSMVALTKLFTSSGLQAELASLEDQQATVLLRPYKPTSLSNTLALLAQTNTNHNYIGSVLAFADLNDKTACLTLARLDYVVQLMPTWIQSVQQLSIISRSVQWEICRAMIVVYHWIMVTGPALADLLIKAHVAGISTLEREFPGFSRLIQHIFLYVEAQQAAPPKRRIKKAKLDENLLLVEESDTIMPASSLDPAAEISQVNHPELLWPPKNFSLPPDLYGLRPSTKRGKQLPMPPISGVGQIANTILFRHKAVAKCFLDLILREFIMSSMLKLDSLWNTSRRRRDGNVPPAVDSTQSRFRSSEREKAEGRLICRCAVLKCFVDICGTEGIFACGALDQILASPTALFPSNLSSDTRFMKAILKDEKKTLAPLYSSVQRLVTQDPLILEYAAKIGAFVHHRALELQQGRAIARAQILNPHISIPKQKPLDPAGAAGKANRLKRPPIISATVQDLVPMASQPILFAKLGLVLREALNAKRGLDCAEESLRRIFEGKNPATGLVSDSNPDHSDPARAFSVNFALLKEHMPPVKLTGPMGLSNLFVWMLTGQGYGTKKFLERSGGNFYFNTLEECINCFDTAITSNTVIITEWLQQHPRATEKDFSTHTSYTPVSDSKVWGQPSDQLKHNPTDKQSGQHLSLADKFTPYFSLAVQEQWVKWLGPMAHMDPSQYKGPRPGWRQAIDFVRSFQFDGVKGAGLTTLQLANNLVLLGICDPPEPEEMGLWISENPGLGAFKGLEALGFVLPDADALLTQIAFQCVYIHLQDNLSDDDKEILGFGVIFVEHVLCKVARWEDRYNTAMEASYKTFQDLTTDLHTIAVWMRDQNKFDPKAFPFPLALDPSQLRLLIDNVFVCIPFCPDYLWLIFS